MSRAKTAEFVLEREAPCPTDEQWVSHSATPVPELSEIKSVAQSFWEWVRCPGRDASELDS